MENLKFNIYALSNPKSKADFDALLDEAVHMAHQLNDQLAGLERTMISNAQSNSEVGAA
ncbi:hypothetical protein PEC18_18645 [Paucibacter sp. O1-1]|nr:hypothetical protein [Paucibacter sp. O1-1]MDA3827817.1 hypothetical protein [Paucibacter sp. O1-1]